MRLITKLNIIKGNILVKNGQLLWKGSKGEFLSKEGKNIPDGLYYVKSSQINSLHEGSEYIHNLEVCEISCDGEGIKPTHNQYFISVCKKDLKDYFGVGNTAAKGLIFEYIKDQFQKAGRIKDFDPNQNYDRVFGGVAGSVFNKAPFKIPSDIQSDLISNAMIQTIDQKTVRGYNPDRKIEVYFLSMFKNRLLNEVKSFVTKQMREVKPKDDDTKKDKKLTQEEFLDLKSKPSTDTPESKLHYKELIQGLKKFMKNRTRGDVQIKVFDLVLEGYSNDDLSKKFNVSPALISRYLNDIRDSIFEYSKRTGNNILYSFMVKHSKNRKHAGEEFSYLMDVFKDYKKKIGSDTKTMIREPSGKVLKIKKIILQDKISDEAISKCILDDSYSSSKLESDLEEYFKILNNQDEIIDSDNKIIGLKILPNEVRNLKR